MIYSESIVNLQSWIGFQEYRKVDTRFFSQLSHNRFRINLSWLNMTARKNRTFAAFGRKNCEKLAAPLNHCAHGKQHDSHCSGEMTLAQAVVG